MIAKESRMKNIEIKVSLVGALKNITLLKVGGYIDTTTAPDLQKTLTEIMHGGISQIIVDLGAVQYVSSAGWGVFVGEIRNLRESGGDLKIVQMTPDVFEVFEMLEFNLILTHYDSIEEAMSDFDFCRGVELTLSNQFASKTGMPTAASHTLVETFEAPTPAVKEFQNDNDPVPDKTATFTSLQQKNNVEFSLAEKVKGIIAQNPVMGAWSIKRKLSSSSDPVKVGYFELRGLLKTLGLDTKARRRRFFRSR